MAQLVTPFYCIRCARSGHEGTVTETRKRRSLGIFERPGTDRGGRHERRQPVLTLHIARVESRIIRRRTDEETIPVTADFRSFFRKEFAAGRRIGGRSGNLARRRIEGLDTVRRRDDENFRSCNRRNRKVIIEFRHYPS